ncbi:MAG TPA: hypothetical protein VN408_41220 [Actinoplanes sp.]|nr:hypothetical protein [Actinoplanes sp.]
MSKQGQSARLLGRRHRVSVAVGCLCSALAASILAVPMPYYGIFAVVAMIVVFTGGVVLRRR